MYDLGAGVGRENRKIQLVSYDPNPLWFFQTMQAGSDSPGRRHRVRCRGAAAAAASEKHAVHFVLSSAPAPGAPTGGSHAHIRKEGL